MTDEKKKASTEVAEVEVKETALTTAAPMSMEDMLESDSGSGMENLTSDVLQIPFLTILQALSPQVTRGNAEYIKDAQQGMIFNTLTKQVYPAIAADDEPGILVSAVYFATKHIEWKDRKKGGGLRRVWGEDLSFQNSPDYVYNAESQTYVNADGESSVIQHLETYLQMLGTPEQLELSQAIVSMKGTQLKKAKMWNSLRTNLRVKTPSGKLINPPSWFGVYRLRTALESNDSGSWFGWKIEHYKNLNEFEEGPYIYGEAKRLYEGIHDGSIRADENMRSVESLSNADVASDIPF
jgi:hypothetical protein